MSVVPIKKAKSFFDFDKINPVIRRKMDDRTYLESIIEKIVEIVLLYRLSLQDKHILKNHPRWNEVKLELKILNDLLS